jgi:hypothetical protein
MKTPRASDNFMDEKTAQGILDEVRQLKQAGAVGRFGKWLVGGNTDREQKEEDKKEKAIEKNLEARRARREAAERWEEEKGEKAASGYDLPKAIQDSINAGKVEQLRSDAMQDITNKALAALGIGMAARGGLGLYNVAFPKGNRLSAQKPTVLDVPYPLADDEDEEEKESADLRAATPRLSVAKERIVSQHIADGGTLKEAIKKAYSDWSDDLVDGHVDDREKCANWWYDTFIKGTGAKEKADIPWHGPGTLLGVVGGGYAGWKILDKILASRRKAEQQKKLDEAKAQFSQALSGQYEAGKQSSDLSGQLDDLYDKFEKTANGEGWVDQNTWGQLGQMYGMYAAPMALFTGIATYRAAAKRRRKEILEKAIKKRKQRRQALAPIEIYARPVPLPIDKEEEEREEADT